MENNPDNQIMPFGKYKGQKLANVPASYLLYLYSGKPGLYGTLKQYVVDNIKQLEQEAEKERENYRNEKKC